MSSTNMNTTRHELVPPSLRKLAAVLASALSNNASSSATVINCLDRCQPPFNLACEDLSRSDIIADISG
ncbi:hypothetical protein BDV40DRAFT_274698 [Aspergillus tamarii]|uniref:Uncharacterized protein n=1 Tax=Aspergillus tamarii TaxID=41984 RepID=A0A5N6UKB7_ASPTM|nr:hypothetical protein BDV40DRAFT_274698 [Aspergillus tamarii]